MSDRTGMNGDDDCQGKVMEKERRQFKGRVLRDFRHFIIQKNSTWALCEQAKTVPLIYFYFHTVF